jgi:hypothetical protein
MCVCLRTLVSEACNSYSSSEVSDCFTKHTCEIVIYIYIYIYPDDTLDSRSRDEHVSFNTNRNFQNYCFSIVIKKMPSDQLLNSPYTTFWPSGMYCQRKKTLLLQRTLLMIMNSYTI